MSKALHVGPSRREWRLGRGDEVLGLLGGFLVSIAIWSLLSAQGGWSSILGILMFLGLPGVGLMALGLRKRRRKLQFVQVWIELEEKRDVPVDALLREANLARPELFEAVAKINRAIPEAFLLDGERDALIDSRLRGRAVVVDRCSGCGAPVNESVEVGKVESVRCSSCGAPVAGSSRDLVDRALAQAEAEASREKVKEVARSRLQESACLVGCGGLLLVGLPLIVISIAVGMLLIFPLIGSLVLWETLKHRSAPRNPMDVAPPPRAIATVDEGWISDPGPYRSPTNPDSNG